MGCVDVWAVSDWFRENRGGVVCWGCLVAASLRGGSRSVRVTLDLDNANGDMKARKDGEGTGKIGGG